jgi:hypothetical protein
MSGQASIKDTNRYEHEIQRAAKSTATTVETSVYRHELAKDRRHVQHQTKVLEDIRQGIHQIAHHAGMQISRGIDLHVHGGTLRHVGGGTVKLNSQDAHELLKLLKKLERRSGKKFA